jgi:hypothetical protein
MTTEDILDWTGIANTDAKAEPIAYSEVPAGRLVVKVTDAEIRDAVVSGYFLVVQKDNPRSYKEGNWRIEVECLWYGKKPKTSWMHLTVNNGFEFLNNYEGEVISNIGS